MTIQKKLEIIAAILILAVISINLFIAFKYYYLSGCKLPEFYLWQAGISLNK